MVEALSTAGLPVMTGEHARVLERLKQLTAWQQAQQERMRAHQQEQIARLQGGGGGDESSPRLSAVDLSSSLQSPMTRTGEEEEEEEDERREGKRGSDSGLGTGCHGSDEENRLQSLSSVSDEDRPIQPGVGRQVKFEEMVERELKLNSFHQTTPPVEQQQRHKPHPFLRRGEGLARFGGVQRSPQRRKSVMKKKKPVSADRPTSNATDNTNRMRCGSNHATIVSSNTNRMSSESDERKIGSRLGSQFSSEESFIIRGCQRFQQEAEELVEFEKLEEAALNISSLSQCSLVTEMLERGKNDGDRVANSVKEKEKKEGREEEEEEEEDLDKTLTSSQTEMEEEKEEKKEEMVKSLAVGVVFSDDEEWDSFTHTSPPPPLPHSELPSSGSCSSSPDKHNYISSTPLPPSSPSLSPSPQPSIRNKRDTTSPSPPPSHLTTQLFPALRQQPPPPETTPTTSATPPRYPNEQEVKERMSQLEVEIDKFRRLNSRLEQQTKEKEEEVKHLKREIGEFQQQMKEEMEQFEHYKREETRKIKKERRVFDAYALERRSGQEKRDREEIEKLRFQVRELEEEMGTREERWRSAMTRQRQRIESLEDQNRELQTDLKVMERERLNWWQEQLERKRQSTPSPPPPPPPAAPPAPTAAKRASLKPQTTVRERMRGKTKTVGGRRGGKRALRPTGQPLEKETKSSNHAKEKPSHVNKTSEGEKKRSTSPLTILEIVSRDLSPPVSDLSPPVSDLWSGSEAGSDVSVLADHIVERVIGPSGRREEEEEEEGGRRSCDDRVKTAGRKSVRFAPEVDDDEENEEEDDKEKEEDGKEKEEDKEGSKVTVCGNGTRKTVSRDGQSISLSFTNGDTKHIRPDGTIVYFYSQSQTSHVTHPDGVEEIQFPNHQVEKVYPDGRREVTFPDGTIKTVEASGEERSIFSDGTVQRLLLDGSREIHYTNGQREIHTKLFKRREYPDGTVKTVYPDGRQETRYSTGRLRVKDSTGTVLVDSWHQTHIIPTSSDDSNL